MGLPASIAARSRSARLRFASAILVSSALGHQGEQARARVAVHRGAGEGRLVDAEVAAQGVGHLHPHLLVPQRHARLAPRQPDRRAQGRPRLDRRREGNPARPVGQHGDKPDGQVRRVLDRLRRERAHSRAPTTRPRGRRPPPAPSEGQAASPPRPPKRASAPATGSARAASRAPGTSPATSFASTSSATCANAGEVPAGNVGAGPWRTSKARAIAAVMTPIYRTPPARCAFSFFYEQCEGAKMILRNHR